MRNKKYVVIIVVIILVLFNGGRWYLAHQAKKELKADVTSHLTEEGYDTENDIEEMYIVNIGKEKVDYLVIVTFKAELDVDYLYMYKDNTREIVQIDRVEHNEN